MFPRLLLAAFLLAHAAVHAGFLSPRPPVAAGGHPWPFELESSWAVSRLGPDASVTRVIGIALVAATLAGFALAAIAALGLLPTGVWAASVTAGTVASIALLALFFHPWLILGLAIDAVLLWAVLIGRWVPDWLTT